MKYPSEFGILGRQAFENRDLPAMIALLHEKGPANTGEPVTYARPSDGQEISLENTAKVLFLATALEDALADGVPELLVYALSHLVENQDPAHSVFEQLYQKYV